MKNLLVTITLLASFSTFAREVNVEGYTIRQAIEYATCDLVVRSPILIAKNANSTRAGNLTISLMPAPAAELAQVRRLVAGRKLRISTIDYNGLTDLILIADDKVRSIRDSAGANLGDMLVNDLSTRSKGTLTISCTDDAPTNI